MFVPSSCCKDPENTPNISKCQGHTDITIIPYTDPPVYIHQLNDQLYTEVRQSTNVLSCQPRVTMTSCSVYKIIRDL